MAKQYQTVVSTLLCFVFFCSCLLLLFCLFFYYVVLVVVFSQSGFSVNILYLANYVRSGLLTGIELRLSAYQPNH